MSTPRAQSQSRFVALVIVSSLVFALFAIASFAANPSASAVASQPSEGRDAALSYGKLPLSFEANHGQTDPRVRYFARGQGYSLYLTQSTAVVVAHPSSSARAARGAAHANQAASRHDGQDVFTMQLAGANPQSRVSAGDPLPGVANYFLGNNPDRWLTGQSTYAQVAYTAVYPGIDLVYYGNQSQLEYDFHLAPGANPASIRLSFTGQKHLRISAQGDLLLSGRAGTATVRKPVVYQQIDGARRSVSAGFRLDSGSAVSFQLGRYDASQPLVIDPVLVYATYLGGTGGDVGNAIAVDASGAAYITGNTASLDFPVSSSAYQSTNKASGSGSGANVFVSKFNATGTALVYSTYLGGSGNTFYGYGDFGNAIAVDSSGNAYVAGTTYSADFPTTTGAFQTVNQAVATQTGGGFVTKLNSTGSALVYSTFLGGGGIYPSPQVTDEVLAIAVDSLGHAYVTGSTASATFPVTSGAFQQTLGNTLQGIYNAFVAKLNPTATALVYSTYLGGSKIPAGGYYQVGDIGNAIAIDSAGNAYVAGRTTSTDFPTTPNAFQTINKGSAGLVGCGAGGCTSYGFGGTNAFVTKLNPTATALVFSTFLGGTGNINGNVAATDAALSLAVDRYGDAFVAGVTNSLDFPAEAPAINPLGPAGDYKGAGFVARFLPDGSSLYYSNFIGNNNSAVTSVAVDSGEKAYIAGYANGGIFPTTDAIPSQLCCAFVARINSLGSAFDFSTFLGGAPVNSTAPKALAIDGSGDVYVTGSTSSPALPVTSGAYQSTHRGGKLTNAFVAKLALANETTDYIPTSTYLSGPNSAVPLEQVATIQALVLAPGYPAPSTGSVTFTGQYTNQANVVTPLAPFTAAIDAQGYATWPLAVTAIGQYQIAASYPGDTNHYGSVGAPFAFTVYGPPAKLIETEYYFYGVTTYGNPYNSEVLGMQVTDAAGTGLSGVTINLSPADIYYSPFPVVTGTGGYAVVYATPHTLGSHIVTASVAGIATPLTFPEIDTTPAPLTVTVENRFKIYGAPVPVPVSSALVIGLVGSDTVNVATQTTATQSSPVGSYPITATVTGPSTGNYYISVLPGTFSVNRAPLNITAKNVVVLYGQTPAQPTAYLLTGFVNGDTAGVVSGAPVLSTSVTSTTPAGVYPITVNAGTLSAANYVIQPFASGEGAVTVAKAPLTIHPNNQTIHAGDPLPVFTYSISGFANGETQSSATTGAPTFTTTAPNTSTPGHYYIVASPGTLAAHNYSFNPPTPATDGILSILP